MPMAGCARMRGQTARRISRGRRVPSRRWPSAAAAGLLSIALTWLANMPGHLFTTPITGNGMQQLRLRSRVRTHAEAAPGKEGARADASPVGQLKALVQDKVGRDITSEDLVYTLYEIPSSGKNSQSDSLDSAVLFQLRLACLPDRPCFVGEAKTTQKAARRAAASAALAGLQGGAGGTDQSRPARAKKNTFNPYKPNR